MVQDMTVIASKTYLVIPGLFFSVHNSGTETTSRVDSSASDWDGGQVNHEYGKSDRERCQYLKSKQLYMSKKHKEFLYLLLFSNFYFYFCDNSTTANIILFLNYLFQMICN
ncbi:hypothetical protein HanIR_Chr07g0326431 [Helianthus annuus]|nr:hypothetical protein HanIR_Chr07g0326431 [Helianthus annuus]